ncbi:MULTISPECIES: SxtJ family membrane protein [Thiorhodovibrio]|uniref:SxtJ family membrane protein n=1 Tax=Thiorhodovibrio TaxID=61593 RepID=UPI0019126533|nr:MULTISPECIES: SxtJ family membrane protein [Thiorhodovibrio]MBK5970227.1 hypothetical protein [Thiorhodovibrio winogradskyi]WPL12731.1 hypothetical protein Thiosp_02510 [Thiorhodovibrio litoralis]
MHSIPELDARGLRQFALTTSAIVAVLFGLILPWLIGHGWPLWPWIIAAVLSLWGLIAPRSLRPVYRGWMHFGLLLNRITSPLILGLVYFVIFVPAGLLMRVFAKDPMQRRRDPRAASYRCPSTPASIDSLEKPY